MMVSCVWQNPGDEFVDEKLGGWMCEPGFPEVPAAGLHKELWTPKFWGRWTYSDIILNLEAKILVMSLR